jgi:hypothetical protein
MTKADVVASVGQSHYDAASWILKKAVPGPDPDLPHVVSPAVWDAPLANVEKIALFFELYDDLPSYAMLMYATRVYRKFDGAARESWWQACLARLGGADDVIREPILYTLWCDYFEDEDLVTDVWRRMTAQKNARITAAILPVSGPVPWPLKAPVYEAAAEDVSLHPALLRALAGSAFDAFGKMEPEPARRLLARLQVPEDLPGYAELRARLAG